MSDGKIFQKALTGFTFDVACGSAIRCMVDKGYTVKQVTERLDYPLSYEKAQKAVTGYLVEKGVLLFKEPDFSKAHTKTEYVKEYGPNGKASFRRVVTEQTEAVCVKQWEEKQFSPDTRQELMEYLCLKTQQNGEEYAYISCDFGVCHKEDYQKYLNSRQSEYLDGILWQGRRAYHRLDYRMKEIAVNLMVWEKYHPVCYFGKTGECVTVL